MDGVSWAIGLFEGEGSVVVTGNSLRLTLPSNDHDTLLRLQQVWGGRVTGPYGPGKNKLSMSDSWRWAIYGDEAKRITNEIEPHLGVRRRSQVAACWAALRVIAEERQSPRPCRICGQDFVPSNPRYASRTLYCSKRCKARVSNGYVLASNPRSRFVSKVEVGHSASALA